MCPNPQKQRGKGSWPHVGIQPMLLAVSVNPPNFTVLDGLRTAGLVNTSTKSSFSSNATAAAAQSFLHTAYSIRDIGRQREALGGVIRGVTLLIEEPEKRREENSSQPRE
jgi:hypothetical protein